MRAVGDEGGEEDMDQEREGESDGDGGTASCSGRSSSEKLLRRNLKGRFAACVGRCGGTPAAREAYIASENEGRERAGRAGGERVDDCRREQSQSPTRARGAETCHVPRSTARDRVCLPLFACHAFRVDRVSASAPHPQSAS